MSRLMLVALIFCAGAAQGAECVIAPDRMTVVDGERKFILGLYEYPKEEAALDAALAAGFNLVQSTGATEQLDRLHAAGAYAWVNTGGAIQLDPVVSAESNMRRAELKALVEKNAGHPAMLVWEVPDEALWNVWYMAHMAREVEEPKQLKERIDALTDAAQQETLRAKLAAARAAYGDNRPADGEQLADDIWRALGETPPHAGYGLSNAVERQEKLLAELREGYAALRQLDPKHPVWMNHAPRNSIAQLTDFGTAADMVGCDIYPVPAGNGVTGHSDLLDQTLSSVGAYTRRMQESAPGKPVWMVLQGFGWQDLGKRTDDPKEHRPYIHETRFMAYDAIVHGARALLYWGTAYVEKDSDFWKELLTVIEELRDLSPTLAAPDAGPVFAPAIEQTMGSLDRAVVVLPKSGPDGTTYIVVNESPYTLTYLLPVSGDAAAYAMYPGGNEVALSDGLIHQTITGFQVQVLQPRK